MSTVCFYFQLHQPTRLRRYSVFDTDKLYFDDFLNTEILNRVSEKCYIPAFELLLQLVEHHQGQFRFTLSLTGILIEQFQQHQPRLIKILKQLADSGGVEFLSETYYHSLAFLYSRDEFREQVHEHAGLIEDLFGHTPSVFRNTELIYNNDLGYYVDSIDDYLGVLTEGADQVLDGRSPNHVYRAPNAKSMKILLKNYTLSDDIAFRFSDPKSKNYPLTPKKFADSVSDLDGPVCNLFMDLETFGEHQWKETGIFDFLRDLPEALLEAGHHFSTVSETMEAHEPVGDFDCPNMISWADTERDLSAWLGNAMQSNASHELYKLERPIKETDDPKLLKTWRQLTTSDHLYYMSTKNYDDGAVHDYFSPYESPYDAYINFMNVLDNLRSRIEQTAAST